MDVGDSVVVAHLDLRPERLPVSALSRGFVESLLREFPEFSVEQAVRLERRLRLEDAAYMAEQTLAEIAALPTVKP